MSVQWAFVDESKEKKYTLVATIIPGAHLVKTRKAMRALLAPGQTRIHFKNESPQRRRKILAAISLLIHQNLYSTSSRPKNKDARTECLESLIPELLRNGVTKIVFEADESLVQAERRYLAAVISQLPEGQELMFEHLAPRQEPCLWIPDAVAWSVQRGGEWSRKVLVARVAG
ncbi:MAG: hypothetical protein RIS55_699 [Actinomycetota bacterium]|jgi:hypothetical protein